MTTGLQTTGAALADAVAMTAGVPLRFLDGFTDANRCAQPVGLPNHVAWILGHCALNMQRAADTVRGVEDGELPASDFVTGDGAAGDASRFDTESICFGSEPVDDPARYPTLDRCVEIYRASGEELARAVRAADEASLAREVTWGTRTASVAGIVATRIFHNGVHTGQLLDLRRAFGMARVIG